MPIPYENATSGEKALGDIHKMLRGFGCNAFGSMIDDEKKVVVVQFEWRQRRVHMEASYAGYAAAWLREHPWSVRMKLNKQKHEEKALTIASVAVYSVLRDWIKGQVTAIETGILSFEGAFLGQIMLPSGMTILEHAKSTKLLPPPKEANQ